MAMVRLYPTNAPRGGTTTLTGAGSANDVFTFNEPVMVVVQNDTAATIFAAVIGGAASTPATQGDIAITAGTTFKADAPATWVALYGVAATPVNGTSAGGIVIYGVE